MASTTTPISADIVSRRVQELGIKELGKASIREIKKIVDLIEAESGARTGTWRRLSRPPP